ncbi:ACP S-malonyltransferase [Falsarthrobacter nasiphocae]|uniref:[acyl-carrier-protein] S-malonyltransferase n=1 Tax=Falsarthrobacter nasiphocae TaxID=189863 RepID=A0AAE3YFI8_9MICC|nr:ACP S-malonyltransferase [Falsarthrobacter nasiphocae]MDR6892878.1 [acyl-carrier-protein] S-malonyltransferase [Falsarthrobacter nasiphocae]
MLAIVCPGQGSQVPGFLTPWLELPQVAAQVAALSEASKIDLLTHGTESDEATIKDTAVAQPLIVAAGLISARALGVAADVYAGHSVGEITAAALAGVFSDADAAALVGERGRLMASAAAEADSTMAAVLGGAADEVEAAIDAAGAVVANNNCPGQLVAAGSREAIERLMAEPPAKAKVIELKVAGAFHTNFMDSAVEPLTRAAEAVLTQDPEATLLTNRDGSRTEHGKVFLDLIVDQVTRPVRWDLCMQTMADLGVTGILEVAPAGTLTGLAKRGLRGVERFSLSTPDQLDDAREFARAHARTAPDEAQTGGPQA